MGAGEFHGRVRDGIGCRLPAKATRSSNPPSDRFVGAALWGLPYDRVVNGSGCECYVRCVVCSGF